MTISDYQSCQGHKLADTLRVLRSVPPSRSAPCSASACAWRRRGSWAAFRPGQRVFFRIAIGKLAGQNNPALSILSIKVEVFSEFLSPIGSGINPPIVEYNVVWLTLLAFQSARNDGRTTILVVQACEVTIRRVRILMAHFAWPGSSSHLNNSQPISRVLMTKPQKLYCAV